MVPSLNIRSARIEDADDVAGILRRSIIELCIEDHANQADVLTGWLSNKTTENVRDWIDDPRQSLVVCEWRTRIVCVGSVRASEILLLYVSPDFRFSGASKAILDELEMIARSNGHDDIRLTSTATARSFYLERGYKDIGAPELWFGGNHVYAMGKALV